jgi:hypothetical protein
LAANLLAGLSPWADKRSRCGSEIGFFIKRLIALLMVQTTLAIYLVGEAGMLGRDRSYLDLETGKPRAPLN